MSNDLRNIPTSSKPTRVLVLTTYWVVKEKLPKVLFTNINMHACVAITVLYRLKINRFTVLTCFSIKVIFRESCKPIPMTSKHLFSPINPLMTCRIALL